MNVQSGFAAPTVPADPPVPRNLVFDIGQVLLVWDPQLLYGRLVPDPVERARLFEEVFDWAWRDRSDYAVTVRENCADLARRRPDVAHLALAWDREFATMMPGPVAGAWELVAELQAAGRKVFSIANFAADKYAESRARFPFMDRLDGMLVSAEVMCKKPDPLIYRLFLERYGLAGQDCLFVDDDPANVAGARQAGMQATVFESVEGIRAQLVGRGVLP